MELILRFLGLYFHAHSYSRPMKGFLNNYMATNRDLDRQPADVIEPLFEGTVECIRDHIGDRAFKPKTAINAAVVDSVMVGVARRLDFGPITDQHGMRKAYDALVKDEDYAFATSRSTADEEQVGTRLDKATAAFADLG
jgi:hypothetical protein